MSNDQCTMTKESTMSNDQEVLANTRQNHPRSSRRKEAPFISREEVRASSRRLLHSKTLARVRVRPERGHSCPPRAHSYIRADKNVRAPVLHWNIGHSLCIAH